METSIKLKVRSMQIEGSSTEYERFFSKDSVVPCRWISETLKLGIKKVDNGKIPAV